MKGNEPSGSEQEWNLIADQKTAESIWVVLTEAGRRGKISEQIGDGDVAIRLADAYEKIRMRLTSEMRTIRWKYDEIVDFDVKISKNTRSSLNGDPTSQRIVVNLKVIPAGETEVKTLVVDFDEAQLEDFIWRLQEAKAMKERIQKAVTVTTGSKKKATTR
ncbi:hypothetical protein GCK72_008406 [Caenorhabditis remanei]|uniref:COMM domain-containing protein n=1 Tax=Caenorhabditis remanei TaxID=31234 RepID=A0A6A5GXI5_CAERE|nr:hypothetical protein GCK72_008406 [Caenorhabditis remanei]KAF1760160.1 hypothetical protein GCK72_008406 [Caenorhabditis remanei]